VKQLGYDNLHLFASLLFCGAIISFIMGAIQLYNPVSFPYDSNFISDIGGIDGISFTLYLSLLLFAISNIFLFFVVKHQKRKFKMEILQQTQKQELKSKTESDKASYPKDAGISIAKLQLRDLEKILKGTRKNVFNLLLDPNGINTPDDMQAALDSIEEGLVCLRKSTESLN
tara:strand:- start:12227 stop:12742 length:516 start_codon:yes stop_codon:yes gene_type:complete